MRKYCIVFLYLLSGYILQFSSFQIASLIIVLLTISFLILNLAKPSLIIGSFILVGLWLKIIDLDNLNHILSSKSFIIIVTSFIIAAVFALSSWVHRIVNVIFKLCQINNYFLLLAFMLVTFILSSIINNTTAVIMMLSVLNNLLTKLQDYPHFKSIRTNFIIGVILSSLLGGNVSIIASPSSIYTYQYWLESLNYKINFFAYLLVGFSLSLMVLLLINLALYLPIRQKMPNLVFNHDLINKIQPISLTDGLFIILFVIFIISMIGVNINYFAIMAFGIFILFCQNKSFNKTLKSIANIPYYNLILIFGGMLFSLILQQNVFNSAFSLDFLNNYATASKLLIMNVSIMMGTEFLLNSPTLAMFLPIFASLLSLSNVVNSTLIVFLVILSANSAFILPQSTPGIAILWAQPNINKKTILYYGLLAKCIILIVSLGCLALYQF